MHHGTHGRQPAIAGRNSAERPIRSPCPRTGTASWSSSPEGQRQCPQLTSARSVRPAICSAMAGSRWPRRRTDRDAPGPRCHRRREELRKIFVANSAAQAHNRVGAFVWRTRGRALRRAFRGFEAWCRCADSSRARCGACTRSWTFARSCSITVAICRALTRRSTTCSLVSRQDPR